jgi:hypothetical protein
MKKILKKEDIICSEGLRYTRVSYSNGDIKWFDGFNNTILMSIDEISFGDNNSDTLKRLNKEYNNIKNQITKQHIWEFGRENWEAEYGNDPGDYNSPNKTNMKEFFDIFIKNNNL